MGFVTINNQERLVIFGGQEYHIVPYYSIQIRKPRTIEIYNTKTEQWETSCIKLNKPRADFDWLTVKFGQIQQQLWFQSVELIINQYQIDLMHTIL